MHSRRHVHSTIPRLCVVIDSQSRAIIYYAFEPLHAGRSVLGMRSPSDAARWRFDDSPMFQAAAASASQTQ